MNATVKIDAARVELLLNELRLPGIKLIWAALAETADKEGWPAAHLPGRPRRAREMVGEAGAASNVTWKKPACRQGKTLDAFDFDAVPMVSKAAQVQAARRRHDLARKGRRLFVFWAMPCGEQIASGGGARHGSDRKRLACVCSPEPPTSYKNSRSRAAISCSKRRSRNSTNIITPSSTISPMSPRIKPRPAFTVSSLSSARYRDDDPMLSSPPISHSVNGAKSSRIKP